MTRTLGATATRTREPVADQFRNEFKSTGGMPDDPMVDPRVHVVRSVIAETPNVVTLDVVPVDGAPAPFLPAQVSMVGAFGIGEAAISISSSAAVHDHHEYTIRRAGAITTALCALEPGDQLTIRGPFGRPWDLDALHGDVVIAAGGIGLAPLRSAIHALLDTAPLHPDRRVVLVVGARHHADLLYAGHYDDWRARGIDVLATIDNAEAGWTGQLGLVPDVVADLDVDWPNVSALLCGPDVMMELTGDRLLDLGAAPGAIQLTLERNMQCATGRCGHCQLGPVLVCRDGPVVTYPEIADALRVRER
jgi:anaerobic sulfite reductase subunit B